MPSLPSTTGLRAYIQGDWVASPVAGNLVDEQIRRNYDDFLVAAQTIGIVNVATWHRQAVGVISRDTAATLDTDVLRNCSEIDAADVVITYLQRNDPPKKHWGSLALMAYAVGVVNAVCCSCRTNALPLNTISCIIRSLCATFTLITILSLPR